MGDRANICLDYGGGQEIFLYSHWGGSMLPESLAKALEFGKPRWGDESYLGRIIVSQVFGGDHNQTTGAGLSPYVTDGDDRIIRVDLINSTVSVRDRVWSFDEFLALDDYYWDALSG